MSRKSFSILEYHSRQDNNRCGYCNQPNTSHSHGMTTHFLTVQHYQMLIDRGWRRSGNYCYKPMMDVTCCPSYTIRCEALEFKLSKSKKKVLKRMIKFLKNELTKDDEDASPNDCDEDIARNMEVPDYLEYSSRAKQNTSKMQVTSVSDEIINRIHSASDDPGTSKQLDSELNKCHSNQAMETSSVEGLKFQFDPNKAPQKKAKQIRLERKQNKLLAQGKTQEEVNVLFQKNKANNAGKTLEDYFEQIANCTNKLELKLVRTSPISDSYKNASKESFKLYREYQKTIHRDKLSKLTEAKYERFLVKSPLRVKLLRTMSDESIETLDESTSLLQKYQTFIHKEKPEDWHKQSYLEYFVKTPLQEWESEDGPPQGYGSFHEEYWYNGTLIAVGVLDILPLCVSSVYFFYDPAYSHLSLGTFSSLREVYLTRQLNKYAPSLKYYYMGYYIHSCIKMKYKAHIKPAKLLCPQTYVWCDIDQCIPKLNLSKYCRFNEDPNAKDEDGHVDIQKVLVLYENKAMPYAIYKKSSRDSNIEDEIREYASLVGTHCAQNMLYFID